MNNVKREKKQELAKNHHDDSSKCDKKFNEHCKEDVCKGKTHCRKYPVTTYTVVCEKEVTRNYEWGYQQKHKGKWEPTRPEDVPKKCHKGNDRSSSSHSDKSH